MKPEIYVVKDTRKWLVSCQDYPVSPPYLRVVSLFDIMSPTKLLVMEFNRQAFGELAHTMWRKEPWRVEALIDTLDIWLKQGNNDENTAT